MPYKLHQLSTTDWLVFCCGEISASWLFELDRLVSSPVNSLEEWIMGDGSLLLSFKEPVTEQSVASILSVTCRNVSVTNQVAEHKIKVSFDGPDIEKVAQSMHLTVDSYIDHFCRESFKVGFMGFSPGFGYLMGGEGSCDVPRREEPRERMQAGAVAVASGYACIYPVQSPGGWNWIGQTEAKLFKKDNDIPFLFSPLDRVRFVRKK